MNKRAPPEVREGSIQVGTLAEPVRTFRPLEAVIQNLSAARASRS